MIMSVLLIILYYIYNFVFRPMRLAVMSSFFSVGSREYRLFLVHCMATKKSVVLIVVIQMARCSLELLCCYFCLLVHLYCVKVFIKEWITFT